MLVHKITEENAEALKIQTGQVHQNRKIKPDELRKTKKRTYKKRYCSVTGCSKVLVRLENHLRQTHKIKDDSVFKKLLKMAVDYEELKTESECSETESEDNYEAFKKRLKRDARKKSKKERSRVNNIKDNSDEEWLAKCLRDKEFKESKIIDFQAGQIFFQHNLNSV